MNVVVRGEVFVVGIVSLLAEFGAGDLTVDRFKECGQIVCGFAEFCSHIDGTCKPCSKICDEGPNQEILLCNKHCQDYIHEMRFLKRDDNLGYHEDRNQIQKLQVLSTVSLIISLVVFVCLLYVVITLWLNKKTKFNVFKLATRTRRKNKDKIDIGRKNGEEISTIRIQDDKMPNIHELSEVMHPNNRPRTPQIDYSTLTTTFKNYHARSEPDTSSTVCTTKCTSKPGPCPSSGQILNVRLPSEDSTLDFMYDNPALAPSPTLEKEAAERRGSNDRGGENKIVSRNGT